MSPILDLQRRVTEVGRIRMGTSTPRAGGGKIPRRLETWRLTSSDKVRLDAAAEALGGTVNEWEGHGGQWDLVTETDRLSVILIPGQNLSQWWELWGQARAQNANVCLRRCNGRDLVGGYELGAKDPIPCVCPDEYDERREAAAKGKACKPYSRLLVILRDVPGFGGWRLETAGVNAALELAGATPILERVTMGGELVPAFLRIDWRQSVRAKPDGSTETLKYPVPVLDIDERIDRIAQLAGGRGTLEAGVDETPGVRTLPAPERVTVRAGLEAAAEGARPKTQSARAAAPIGPGVAARASSELEGGEPESGDVELGPKAPTPAPSEAEIVEGEAEEVDDAPPAPEKVVASPKISDAQRSRLWTIARGRDLPDEKIREIVLETAGVESTSDITRDVYDAVIVAIQGAQIEPAAEAASS